MRRFGLALPLALAALAAASGLQGPTRSAEQERFAVAIASGRRVLHGLVDTRQVPGVAVGVAVGGRIVWSEGFGYADLEHRVPATAATRFGLGSLSKTFTMAGVLSLVDDGRLDLDAPLERYLPGFPHRGRGVTLRRLAAHQSGLSDAFEVAHYQTTEHFPTIESAYERLKGSDLEFDPGRQPRYVTGTYTLIARAMEVAAGKPYLELMQQRVFGPAAMTSVVPNDPRQLISGRTRFYVAEGGGFRNGPCFDPSFKLPGAGFLATAEDVARFGAALLRPGLLSEHGRAEMFRPVPLADGTPTEFALGLRYAEEDGRVLLHQPGGGIGISTWLFLFPREDVVLALLSNVTGGAVGGSTRRQIAAPFLDAGARG